MKISRSMKALIKDSFGAVDITLTEDEMVQVYEAVKRYLLKKDIERYLTALIVDGKKETSLTIDNACEYAEQIVDDVEWIMSSDDYLSGTVHEFMRTAVSDNMYHRFGIDI